jgi:hypothetical protein
MALKIHISSTKLQTSLAGRNGLALLCSTLQNYTYYVIACVNIYGLRLNHCDT